MKAGPAKNYYATTPEDPDPFFHPRSYRLTKKKLLEEIRAVIRSLSGWTETNYHEIQGRLQAERRGFLFGLGESVDFYILPGQEGKVRLEMVSRSKAGKGGLNRNRKNLWEFLTRLDARWPVDSR
jgi:uncharacterized protein (DUF1499 family)